MSDIQLCSFVHPVMLHFTLLSAQVQNSHAQTSGKRQKETPKDALTFCLIFLHHCLSSKGPRFNVNRQTSHLSSCECFFWDTMMSFSVPDAVFLRIDPNRQQHFEYEPITFHCEGSDGSTRLRGTRNTEEIKLECETGSSCTIDRVYSEDSGEYWCETKGGERSNRLNVTVTGRFFVFLNPLRLFLILSSMTLK